jgi:hypothetical protein
VGGELGFEALDLELEGLGGGEVAADRAVGDVGAVAADAGQGRERGAGFGNELQVGGGHGPGYEVMGRGGRSLLGCWRPYSMRAKERARPKAKPSRWAG